MALPILASAYDCQVDGIYYNLNPEEKTAEVTYQKMISYNNPQSDYSGSVTIPEKFTYDGVEYSVTSIGERAFLNCSGLTSMSIGNSVTSIGGFAFHNCSSLTSVTIPNSVTSIGENAFAFCSGLSSIILETGNTIFDSRDNCNAIIESNSNTLIVGCKNTVIPSSVTRIGDKAFCGCSGLTTVTIPSSVSSIGWYAFCGCSSLTSVTIPNSVTSIEQGAFDGCNALTSVTIPNSVTSIGLDAFNGCTGLTSVHITDLEAWCKISFIDDTSNPLSYAHHLYLNGEEIKDLVIPNLLKSIVRNSFVGCSGLTSITIPNSVTIIEKRAFVSCSSLTSVTIPNSVTSIGVNAFRECI